MNRSTAVRDRHRAAIRRDQPYCHICQRPIDYSLPHLHPGSFVVDHVVPLARGGLDVLDNKAAAHRACNRAKSDKLLAEYKADEPWLLKRRRVIASFKSERDWARGRPLN